MYILYLISSIAWWCICCIYPFIWQLQEHHQICVGVFWQLHHVCGYENLSRCILGRCIFQKRKEGVWWYRENFYRWSEYPQGWKRCQWQLFVHKYDLWPWFVIWERHDSGVSSKSTIFSVWCGASFCCVTSLAPLCDWNDELAIVLQTVVLS